MKQLTKIEQLDQRFPGLVNQVKKWFDLGVHVRQVAKFLLEQYGVSVPKSTVGNFRARRWACEREARQNVTVRREAVEEVCRELALKDCPEAPTASLQAKVRSLVNLDVSVCFKRAAQHRARE